MKGALIATAIGIVIVIVAFIISGVLVNWIVDDDDYR